VIGPSWTRQDEYVADAHALADLEATNLDADEWSSDISNVTSVLKLWLRELPEPLLTLQLHPGFLDAASKHPSRPHPLTYGPVDRATGFWLNRNRE